MIVVIVVMVMVIMMNMNMTMTVMMVKMKKTKMTRVTSVELRGNLALNLSGGRWEHAASFSSS